MKTQRWSSFGSALVHPHVTGSAFTLIELLVSVVIITLLLAVLVPSLVATRGSAIALGCSVNLRSIGQAMHGYAAEQRGTLPFAYGYNCDNYFPRIGLTHWSALLLRRHQATEQMFECPTFPRGGLPPADTTADNLEPGQSNNEDSYLDSQAKRCAYTLNEALVPQPYTCVPQSPFCRYHYVGATNVDPATTRLYRSVNVSEVRATAETVLGTEWHHDWRMVSGPVYSNAGKQASLSYRPVHGFAPVAGKAVDPFDMCLVLPASSGAPGLRRLTPADISANPQPPGWQQPRLNWLGRNHSVGGNRTTNFVYLDGHLEPRTIEKTLRPFQWGEKVYSLRPGNDIAEP